MYRFKVEKMHCKSCFLNIEDSLKELDEEIKAKADIPARLLEVESSRSKEEVTGAIMEAGFSVEEI